MIDEHFGTYYMCDCGNHNWIVCGNEIECTDCGHAYEIGNLPPRKFNAITQREE